MKASLPYEEWNAAPPERGVVGQAPQTDGHESWALTVVGQGEGPCHWLLSPASAAPPAVTLKQLAGGDGGTDCHF